MMLSSRRSLLRRLGALAMLGFVPPGAVACRSSGSDEANDLAGASLEASLRGSFLPTFDAITVDLASRWEEGRNATLAVMLSEDWRTVNAQIAQQRQGADIAELFGNQPHLFSDRLVDLSELAERVGASLGGWSDEARQSCMVNGVWRALPWSTTRHGLVVRTDILDDVGAAVPTTYDELLDAATRLHEAGAPMIGMTMGENGPSDAAALAYGMLWSFGGQELSDEGRVVLESAATEAALNYFAELGALNADGAFDYTHPDNNDAYLAGSLAITQNPSSIYLAALDLDPTLAENTTNTPLPAGPAGQFHLPEINSLAIFRHSSDAFAASDWIESVSYTHLTLPTTPYV